MNPVSANPSPGLVRWHLLPYLSRLRVFGQYSGSTIDPKVSSGTVPANTGLTKQLSHAAGLQ